MFVKGGYIHLPSHKRIQEVSFEDEVKHFIQTKYGWNSLTINNIDWELHSIQYNKLISSRKRSIARFIHHRLPSSNMMLKYKHRYPFCTLNSIPNTNHDHYLTCALTRESKNKRLTSLLLKLETLHTPPFLWDNIINIIDKYYNNGLVDDITASCSTSFKEDINNCTYHQQCVDWGHFLRGRISTSFHSPINFYYRSNHLGKRFTSSFWLRSLIPFLWDLHHNAWLHYCNSIHTLD